MTLVTSTPANRVKIGDNVPAWNGYSVGIVTEIHNAPANRLYIVGRYGSVLGRSTSRVKVVR